MDSPLRIYAELRGYGNKGPRYTVKLGAPNGALLCEGTTEPLYSAARILLARGFAGKLQLWDSTRPYYRMQGDIAWLAKMTVAEDKHGIALRRFVERSQDGLSPSETSPPQQPANASQRPAPQGLGGTEIDHQKLVAA